MPEPLDVHQALFVALYSQAIERAYRAADAINRDHPELRIRVESPLPCEYLEFIPELGRIAIRFEVAIPYYYKHTTSVHCFADETSFAMERAIRKQIEVPLLAIARAESEEGEDLEETRRRVEELL